ncbi:hypothetical protein [Streptomyces werraensis]|uniref:hypothetical protein n=1 Tax=Streptomyces werraensis TaxID=68284 RepID=UPI001CE25B8D
MDAGLAAVLGALAGSVATIGAALATGWAQRESARIAARAEHRRERRGPRLEAYRKFISVASQFRRESSFFVCGDFIPDDLDDATVDALHEMAGELQSSALEVSLAGPRRVSKEVIKIQRMSSDLVTSVLLLKQLRGSPDVLHPRLRRRFLKDAVAAARGASRAIDGFVLRAQAALDDDGSVS